MASGLALTIGPVEGVGVGIGVGVGTRAGGIDGGAEGGGAGMLGGCARWLAHPARKNRKQTSAASWSDFFPCTRPTCSVAPRLCVMPWLNAYGWQAPPRCSDR